MKNKYVIGAQETEVVYRVALMNTGEGVAMAINGQRVIGINSEKSHLYRYYIKDRNTGLNIESYGYPIVYGMLPKKDACHCRCTCGGGLR